MDTVIDVQHLTHAYGSRVALRDLSLQVRRGEVLGLLGPNGAGKTTTVRLLNGLFTPQAGSMRVLGLDPLTQGEAVRRQSGVLTETPALYERLTARQNLMFFGGMADLPSAGLGRRVDEALDTFGLQERADDRAGTFSKGMKQRLALARALLANPPLLFLDEPTSGLDPEAAAQVHELIAGIRARDHHTVLLCTHNLNDAQRLCDRLAVLKQGCLLALGTLDELRRSLAPHLWVDLRLLSPAGEELKAALQSLPGVQDVVSIEGGLSVRVGSEEHIPPLVEALVARRAQVLAVAPRQASLEEMYFKLQEQEVTA